MRSKTYKPALLIIVLLMIMQPVAFAQVTCANQPTTTTLVKTGCNGNDVELKIDGFGADLKISLRGLGNNLNAQLNNIAPKIKTAVDKLIKNVSLDDINSGAEDLDINIDKNDDDKSGRKTEKTKSYSKTYPIDGNDRIKLNSQYSKIIVNTWDRHEVKVDVVIDAQAGSDDDAQKLMDAVQISDGKNGDEVYFKTDIAHSNNDSWSFFNWGGKNKKHKLTINYTVYMPAKTDLIVRNSFGSVVLPDLDGKLDVNLSYCSMVAQRLTNPDNDIEGSYGSLKINAFNGARLSFSYGSVEINECNNLKAGLSYGSFKIGRLKGSADLDLSNVGDCRISEIAPSFKRLNINSSYSSLTLGVSPDSNFNFDIISTYGGFDYNDKSVTILSKTPPDGSKYFSNTKTYKGRVGRDNNAVVNIRSSYGGINFE